MTQVELVGRSSSHFTRTARIFALELDVTFSFRPVLDLTALDADAYADNPALKVPVLIDEHGPLFGTENICRALVCCSAKAGRVVMRGDVSDRVVANAEEMTLHVMTSEVSLIMAKMAGDVRLAPPKVTRSIENALHYLDAHVDAVQEALPADRTLSFLEVTLFCVAMHLPFREVMDVSSWSRLGDFCRRFGERESARATTYRFDPA
jgi:glutathione S-transferase